MRSPLGAKGRLLGARTGLVAERGGASSPEHGVRPREGATDCTNTPKGSAGGGYSHRGSNSGDGVAQGAGGVSLAAELDGAWRRVDAGLGVEVAGSGEFVASEQSSPGGLPWLGRRGAPGTRRRSSCSDSGGAAARLRAAARVGEAA
jgi:hypothetical protein